MTSAHPYPHSVVAAYVPDALTETKNVFIATSGNNS